MTLARGTDRIESARLTLRRIDHDDFDFFIRLNADAEVVRYLPFGKPRSAEQSLAWLQSVRRSYDDLGLGQLAVVRKSDGTLIGRCGLSDLAVEARAIAAAVPRGWYQRADASRDTEIVFEQELGYTFHRGSWVRGTLARRHAAFLIMPVMCYGCPGWFRSFTRRTVALCGSPKDLGCSTRIWWKCCRDSTTGLCGP